MSSAGPSLVKSLGVEYISDETNLVNLQSESHEKSVSLNISKGLDAKKSLAIDVPKPQQVSSPGKQYAAQMARKRRQSNLSTSSPLGKVLVATAPPVNAEEVKLNASTVKTSESSVSTGQNITPPEVMPDDGTLVLGSNGVDRSENRNTEEWYYILFCIYQSNHI